MNGDSRAALVSVSARTTAVLCVLSCTKLEPAGDTFGPGSGEHECDGR